MKFFYTLLFVFCSIYSYSQCPPNVRTNGNGNRITFVFDDQAARDAAAAAISSVTYNGTSYPVAPHPSNVEVLRSASAAPAGTFTGIDVGTQTITLSPSGDVCTYIDGALPALPVTLISFDAQEKQRQVILDWSTASEENNSHFEIERSVDGRTFKSIGKVTGAGNSVEFVKYSFIDAAIRYATVYYRLKQVDFDGNYSFSNLLVVNLQRDSPITVFPSSVYDKVTLDLEEASNSETLIEVFDVMGKKLMSHIMEINATRMELNVSNFARGHYFINLRIGNETYTERFIKVK